jgi:hypothetical protein
MGLDVIAAKDGKPVHDEDLEKLPSAGASSPWAAPTDPGRHPREGVGGGSGKDEARTATPCGVRVSAA